MTATKKKTVIITGASGFLGTALVQYFKKEGWRVIGLVRNADKYSELGVKYFEYDLSKPFDSKIFTGADYLVHTAYVKYDSNNPDALKINLEAAKRLIKASREHKLKKEVFISSMSAHAGAESIYGKQKLAIEKVFKGPDCAIIRSGLIMGDGGMVKQMTDFMKSKHAVPLIGGGKQPLQVVAVYDLVRVIKVILAEDHTGTLTIATPEVYTYKAFYDALRKHLGIVVVFVPIPLAALLTIVKLTSVLHLPISINEDNVLGLKNLRSAETAADLHTLGLKLDNLDQILSKSN